MKQTRKTIGLLIAILAIEAWALYTVSRTPANQRSAMIVADDPQAHARYDAMVRSLREARSLSYTAALFNAPDMRKTHYKVSLKKPRDWRVEVTNGMTGKTTTLVGNSESIWVYWYGTRAYWKIDTPASHEKTKANVFIKREVCPEGDSIAREIAALGLAWFDPILDPSFFHGRADPQAPAIDGIRSRGFDTVAGEACDVIEISYDRAERTRYLWLSRQDHLPRRIKEIVRLEDDHTLTVARWSKVTRNPDLPPSRFTWSPPAEYERWPR